MTNQPDARIEVRGLVRRYQSFAALGGVDWSARAGEVHALVGANGAGKSTLINLISGNETPDEGQILVDGVRVQIRTPGRAQALGIATVHQELSLVPGLSVARNIYLGREPERGPGIVDRRLLEQNTLSLLARHGLQLDPQMRAGQLSVAEQQLVEIAKALSIQARVLILDEPTAVLSLAEKNKLFDIIRALREQGMLVLFVSHFLDEVLNLADTVTVFRDGLKVATRAASELAVPTLVGLMTGTTATPPTGTRRKDPPATTSTATIQYRAGDRTSALQLRVGEIVGIAGLVGAGRSTFARAVAGLSSRGRKAAIAFDNQPIGCKNPRQAVDNGIVYLTEDRKHDGLFLNLDIVSNATAAALRQLASGCLRRPRREFEQARQFLNRLGLTARSLRQPVVELSGGNQQKVLLARALLTRPRLLLCDEPTRGVDITAKAEIHRLLRILADDGVMVIIISSEIDELLANTDRIVVMARHKLVADLNPVQTTENQILEIASTGSSLSENQL